MFSSFKTDFFLIAQKNGFRLLVLSVIVFIVNANALFGAKQKMIGSICGATRDGYKGLRLLAKLTKLISNYQKCQKVPKHITLFAWTKLANYGRKGQ